MSSSEESECDDGTLTPPEIQEAANAVIEDSLPPKSKEKYLKSYENFVQWKNEKKSKSFSENVFLAYFAELAKKVKPTTLWVIYSMLKSTVLKKHNVDIKLYTNLSSMLKRQSHGYKSKMSKVFTASDVKMFLFEAPDSLYLDLKVILIFGIFGACRCNEITNISIKDVENHDGVIIVSLLDSKTKIDRTFVIRDESSELVQKYMALRPTDVKSDRFFVNYKNNKCTKQVIGRHKIATMPKAIATYLNLPNPEDYTGHCFRRSSATVLADTEPDSLKRSLFRNAIPSQNIPTTSDDNGLTSQNVPTIYDEEKEVTSQNIHTMSHIKAVTSPQEMQETCENWADDFGLNIASYLKTEEDMKKRYLKRHAVPSIFSWNQRPPTQECTFIPVEKIKRLYSESKKESLGSGDPLVGSIDIGIKVEKLSSENPSLSSVKEDCCDVISPFNASGITKTYSKINDCSGQLHEGFQCNVCSQDIRGYRYTCVQCADYDMCCACEAAGAHAAHYVLRVPGPRPYLEVRAVVERIRQELVGVAPPAGPPAPAPEHVDEPSMKVEVKLEVDPEPDPLLGVSSHTASNAGAETITSDVASPRPWTMLDQAMTEIKVEVESEEEAPDPPAGSHKRPAPRGDPPPKRMHIQIDSGLVVKAEPLQAPEGEAPGGAPDTGQFVCEVFSHNAADNEATAANVSGTSGKIHKNIQKKAPVPGKKEISAKKKNK